MVSLANDWKLENSLALSICNKFHLPAPFAAH